MTTPRTLPPASTELHRVAELLVILALVGLAATIGGKLMAQVIGSRPLGR